MDDFPATLEDYEVQGEYWGEGQGEGRAEKKSLSWADARVLADWPDGGRDGQDDWDDSEPYIPPEDRRPAIATPLTEAQRVQARLQDDNNAVKDPCEVPTYRVGEELYLETVAEDGAPVQAWQKICYLKLKILKLLGTPWRSGCAMEVEFLEAPDPDQIGSSYVLKLIDYRFLETFGFLSRPTVHSMKRYINMVCCGEVDGFLTMVEDKLLRNHGWAYDQDRKTFSKWQLQALVHKSCQLVAQDEIGAYDRLKELQGRCIPKLMYKVRTCPWLQIELPFSRYFQYEGFVMEKVDGVCLESMSGLSRYLHREIYQEAINAVNSLEYYGFEHRSLAARNLMVRHERQLNGAPSVMLIDLHKHLTWSTEDGYYKYNEVWYHNPEQNLKDCSDYWDGGWMGYPDRDVEWDDAIATGRFAEKSQLVGPNQRDSMRTAYGVRVVANDRALIDAQMRWRVIMDDLWTVDAGKSKLEGIDERARRSRIAYKIMKVSAFSALWFTVC